MAEPAAQNDNSKKDDLDPSLEEFPLNFLGSRKHTFDFDLLDEHGGVVIPRGDIIDADRGKNLKDQGIHLYRRRKVSNPIFEKEAVSKMAEDTAEVFAEIRKSNILADRNYNHSRQMFDRMVKDIDPNFLITGSLSMEKEMSQLDEYNYLHSVNASCLAMVLGMRQRMDPEHLLNFVQAAYYCDVGKNRIPVEVLQKTDPLTPHEKILINSHPQMGYLILNEFANRNPENQAVIKAKLAALLHHMRLDGRGYPDTSKVQALSKYTYEATPPDVKMISLIDYYTALIEERPYRSARTPVEALRIILNESYRGYEINTVHEFLRTVALVLNDGRPFYEEGDHVVVAMEQFNPKGAKYIKHEIAQVETVDLSMITQPTVKLLYSVEDKRQLPRNSINLSKDFTRKLSRVISSIEGYQKIKALGIT